MTSISVSLSSSYTSSVLSLDTNGDGIVSADELAAAEPKSGRSQEATVASENAATGLFSQASGSIIASMLNNGGADANAEKPMSAADMFAAMDADGDGTVTEAEFIAARPDDVTEDMAAELFSRFDSEGTGALTEEQFTAAFEANRPEGPPPPPMDDASETEETVSLADVLDEINAIIEAYRKANETDDQTDGVSISI